MSPYFQLYNDFNTFWLGSQEKPGTKPEAKPDSEGDNADEESEGEAAKTDDKGDTELIRTEGKPGWAEKVLKKVWKYFSIRRSYENTREVAACHMRQTTYASYMCSEYFHF